MIELVQQGKLCYIQYVVKNKQLRYSEVDIFAVTNLANSLSEQELTQMEEQLGVEVLLRMVHRRLPAILKEKELDEFREFASENRSEEEVKDWFIQRDLYDKVGNAIEEIRAEMTKEFLQSYLHELKEEHLETSTDSETTSQVATLVQKGLKNLTADGVDTEQLQKIITEIQSIIYG